MVLPFFMHLYEGENVGGKLVVCRFVSFLNIEEPHFAKVLGAFFVERNSLTDFLNSSISIGESPDEAGTIPFVCCAVNLSGQEFLLEEGNFL